MPTDLQNAWLLSRSEEIQRQLTDHARRSNVLQAGEVIVFSMRIEQQHTAVRDPMDLHEYADLPLDIGIRKPPANSGYKRYVEPAKLNSLQIEQILKLFKPQTRAKIRHLLLERRNFPTTFRGAFYQSPANRVLRGNKIDGKQYTIVAAYDEYQLWEVE